jgi:hypothetical protein
MDQVFVTLPHIDNDHFHVVSFRIGDGSERVSQIIHSSGSIYFNNLFGLKVEDRAGVFIFRQFRSIKLIYANNTGKRLFGTFNIRIKDGHNLLFGDEKLGSDRSKRRRMAAQCI